MKHLIGLTMLVFSLSAVAKVDPAVRGQLNTRGSADILVRMKAQANLSKAQLIVNRTKRIQYVYDVLRKTAARSQRNLISHLKSNRAQFRSFHITNMVAVEGADSALIGILESLPEVQDLVLDISVRAKPNPIDLRRVPVVQGRLPSNLEDINVHKVWTEFGARGQGIVIAGQDSGYAWQHPAVQSQYRGKTRNGVIDHTYSWFDAFNKCKEPCDDSGHGTHTLGSMLGDDGKGNQIGVAPEATWIGCKNMENGVGRASTYLACFEYLLAPYPQAGDPKKEGRPDLAPHIVNNSWACPKSEGCRGDEFIGAVKAMKAAGIMVIVAVGNSGPACASAADAPGNYSGELLSVGAYSHHDKAVASFSSRGPSLWNGGIGPDIVAPGVAIRSAVPSGGLGDGLYDYKSGTSMAAPHAAGVVALLWSARPSLIGKIDETIALIKNTAQGIKTRTCGAFDGGQVPNAVAGHGLIDAYELVKSAP